MMFPWTLKLLFLISTKSLEKKKIEWSYDNITQKISVRSRKNAYVLQIPIPLGNLLGLHESDISFTNPMITSHLFRPSWFYKVFLTNKLIDVLKTQNNLSIYELLGKTIFQ